MYAPRRSQPPVSAYNKRAPSNNTVNISCSALGTLKKLKNKHEWCAAGGTVAQTWRRGTLLELIPVQAYPGRMGYFTFIGAQPRAGARVTNFLGCFRRLKIVTHLLRVVGSRNKTQKGLAVEVGRAPMIALFSKGIHRPVRCWYIACQGGVYKCTPPVPQSPWSNHSLVPSPQPFK